MFIVEYQFSCCQSNWNGTNFYAAVRRCPIYWPHLCFGVNLTFTYGRNLLTLIFLESIGHTSGFKYFFQHPIVQEKRLVNFTYSSNCGWELLQNVSALSACLDSGKLTST